VLKNLNHRFFEKAIKKAMKKEEKRDDMELIKFKEIYNIEEVKKEY
jgi:hypothetical protein